MRVVAFIIGLRVVERTLKHLRGKRPESDRGPP
jgi:hypothetical protein